MMIEQITGGIPTKRVSIQFIENETDEQILEFAMRVAGESRSSLFGWHVHRFPDGSALVSLNTD